MLIDSVTITVRAGKGGDGMVSFLRDAQTQKGGPDGGNGGNGGSVYFQASHDIHDLRQFRFRKKILAENGIPGKKNNLFGKNAPHITIFFPVGTQITEMETGRTYEIFREDKPRLIAKGGRGGRGNNEFKTATNRTPMEAEKGEPGEEKTIHLELRFIAEVGFVGLPNAGKSSLLTVLTHATPKIGDYPFTTLEPNIGMFDDHPLADIPGLIEGASEGKGLGTRFLKHIEKTKFLIHCIDAAQEDPLKAYDVVRNEFGLYNQQLLEKPELILITKVDLVDKEQVEKVVQLFKEHNHEVMICSIYEEKLIEDLKKKMESVLSS